MLRTIIMAIVVAVLVTLLCQYVIGSILFALQISVAVALGTFVKSAAAILGILAGLWYYATH